MAITLKPSRLFLFLALLLSGFALSILYWVDLALWVKAVVALSLVLPLYRLGLMARLKGADTVLQLRAEGHGHWLITTAKGEHRVLLSGESIVTQYICLLLFRNARGRFVSVILPDALQQEQDRRLLVALRFA